MRRRAFGSKVVKLTVVSLLVSLGALYFVPLHYARSTYLSENALQPGLHGVSIGVDRLPEGSMTSLEDVQELLRQEKLETVLQKGLFVVGILRAPRGSARAAIAVSTALPERRVVEGSNRIHSLAFVLKLVRHLQSAKYVSKDVYFLVSQQHGRAGPSAFLDMYYNGEVAFRRSGTIQQALHLNFDFEEGVKKMVFEMEGSRRLPNLDLLNMFVRTAAAAGVSSRHVLTTKKFIHRALKQLPPRVAMFLQFFLTQAVADDSDAAHSVFNEYAADCLTVTHLGSKSKNVRAESFFHAIEGSLRSLFSLQETLHQSFYFYLLPSPWLYVPIGDYMIIFGMSFAIFPAVLVWMALFSDAWDQFQLLPTLLLVASGFFLAFGMWAFRALPLVGMALYVLIVVMLPLLPLPKVNGRLAALCGFGYFGFSLILCVLINFPLAYLGCIFGAAHMAAYFVQSRILLILLDPFLLGLAVSSGSHLPYWISLIWAAVPMRLWLFYAISSRTRPVAAATEKEKKE